MEQITIDDLLTMDEVTEDPQEEEIPVAAEGEKVFTIPDDIWQTRCLICAHKKGNENIPVPLWAIDRCQYQDVIPCRIMRLCIPHEKPGECMSFTPKFGLYGICETCRHNNYFFDGFCEKPDHGEQRRVYYGQDYGGDARKVDYYSRHRLSVCDDYEPNPIYINY